MVHGSASTYVNHRCRCKQCCQAHTEKVADLRRRRREERVLVDGRLVHPTAEHGKDTTYQNYACRCEPCTTAHQTDNNRKADA